MNETTLNKNMMAIDQSLKSMDELIRAQQIRIDGLVATISGLYERMNELEKVLLLMRAKAAGSGATV